ncbi:hypothetical protein Ae201684P_010166 [Aphanomyces euteiches]|nr:hypothetical protein Ae201684P_010166 [Aphanomyces euteiches]
MSSSARNLSRQDFKHAKRIVIKMGTSVVSTNGEPALGRLASLVEQISMLKRQGKEVLLVTSGSIGIGRKKLHKQLLLSASLRTHARWLQPDKSASWRFMKLSFRCMMLHVLVTEAEFKTNEHRTNLRDTILHLLEMDVLPIVNENDAISAGLHRDEDGIFTDNDSLAALIAAETEANLLILLTDVEGVYNKPPSEPQARVLSVYSDESIARNLLLDAVACKPKFNQHSVQSIGASMRLLSPVDPSTLLPTHSPEDMAVAARDGSRVLLQLSSKERSAIVQRLARSLVEQSERILAANQLDLEAAGSLDPQLVSRLKLTQAKLETLAQGIASVANQEEPVGKVVSLTEVSKGLVLEQVTTPIGVILVVFESRPDSLPQIAALALRSGNGLILKGGKEARHSNACLHSLVQAAIREETKGRVPESVIGLVTSRDDVGALLALDHVIDLCIPRGSNSLVTHIKKNTKIPVLGHAEGVCHMYIHAKADIAKAARLAVDAKTDYPAACNALETLVLDEEVVVSGAHSSILSALADAGVTLHVGPEAARRQLIPHAPAAPSLSHEYGSLGLTVEVVSGGVDGAINHINLHSSGHTECIVTEDAAVAETFLARVDSACVFHNASTRFADGYRFGLGAEVGISTGRIHARGPVGVQGLLTTKWKLRSASDHTVAAFSSGEAKYTHKTLSKL